MLLKGESPFRVVYNINISKQLPSDLEKITNMHKCISFSISKVPLTVVTQNTLFRIKSQLQRGQKAFILL